MIALPVWAQTAVQTSVETVETTEDTQAPKLGPNAVFITDDNAYVRSAPAPDYWAFSNFVKPQVTGSDCALATVTAALNGLAGLPNLADEPIMTQEGLIGMFEDDTWMNLSSMGGDGVTFDQLETFTKASLTLLNRSETVTVFHPSDITDNAEAQTEMRSMLTANEASAKDALMVYFNQGVVTGDWDGPHVALIGAYDAAADKVLILEVDQDWYVPYWTPASVLFDAMMKPASAEHGVLEGQTGGFVKIARP
jgi:hypothetical protein